MRSEKQPFYGVDGNLLVEHLPHDFETGEKILNGTFKPTFYAQVFLPSYLMMAYPQLKDEPAHRKAYGEKCELWKKTMKAKRELSGR